jgi:hypothetical protein
VLWRTTTLQKNWFLKNTTTKQKHRFHNTCDQTNKNSNREQLFQKLDLSRVVCCSSIHRISMENSW